MVKDFLKLYNHEQKVRFLEEEYPNELTRQNYASILKASAKFEKDKNKDLCNFAYNDVVDLMVGLRKKTYKSLDVAQTIIIKYVDWCIREGYNQTGINAFKLLNKEDLKKYTHQIAQKNSYIDRNRLYEITNELYNPVDRAIVALLFEAVRGRSEIENTFEEIRNLKFSDVRPISNIITVTRNNGDSRYVTVDERTTQILQDAISQDEYYNKNGEATGRYKTKVLKGTDYIIRTIDIASNEEEDKASVQSINAKFKKFREWLGISFLTPTLVYQSGLIEKCEELEQKFGELKPEHYRLVYQEQKLDERAWYNLKEIHDSFKQNKALK